MLNFQKIQNNLEKKVFFVLRNYFKKKFCESIYEKVLSQRIHSQDSGNFHKGASMVYNLHTKGEEFLKIIFSKNILKICNHYFKTGSYQKDKDVFQFDSIHSRILFGKSKPQNLHIDSRVAGIYPPTHLHFFIYLKKVTLEDGPTQLVPNSHRIIKFPNKIDEKNKLKITGEAGDMIIINSSTWHGSSQKKTFKYFQNIAFFHRVILLSNIISPNIKKRKFSIINESTLISPGYNLKNIKFNFWR